MYPPPTCCLAKVSLFDIRETQQLSDASRRGNRNPRRQHEEGERFGSTSFICSQTRDRGTLHGCEEKIGITIASHKVDTFPFGKAGI
jgi:hypothetical protein